MRAQEHPDEPPRHGQRGIDEDERDDDEGDARPGSRRRRPSARRAPAARASATRVAGRSERTRSRSPYVRARSAVCSRSSSSSGSSLPSPAAWRSRSVTASRSASEARSDEWRAIRSQRYRYGPPMEPEATFNSLVGDLDYPMFIVTACADGERSGCLIGFATQASIDPAALPRRPVAQEPHLPRRDQGGAARGPLRARGGGGPGRAVRRRDGRRGRQVRALRVAAGPGRHAAARRLPQPLRRPRARADGRAATTTPSCSSRCWPSAAPTPTSSPSTARSGSSRGTRRSRLAVTGSASWNREELADSLKRLTAWAEQHAPAPSRRCSGGCRTIGRDPVDRPIVSRDLAAWDRPNFQVAVDAWSTGRGVEVVGLPVIQGYRAGLAELGRTSGWGPRLELYGKGWSSPSPARNR